MGLAGRAVAGEEEVAIVVPGPPPAAYEYPEQHLLVAAKHRQAALDVVRQQSEEEEDALVLERVVREQAQEMERLRLEHEEALRWARLRRSTGRRRRV